jgi:hypothetical protein
LLMVNALPEVERPQEFFTTRLPVQVPAPTVMAIEVMLCVVIVAATPPMVTVLPPAEKPVPVMVTVVPAPPLETLRLVTVGLTLKVLPAVTDWLHELVTTTLPHIPAAIVAVIEVVFCAVSVAVTPPMITALPVEENPVPVITSDEPTTPLVALMLLTVGVILKLVPAAFVWLQVLVTDTVPHMAAAMVTVTDVVLCAVMPALVPPMVTVLPPAEKPVPVITSE